MYYNYYTCVIILTVSCTYIGGGDLVCPVQRVPDFLAETATASDGGSYTSASYPLLGPGRIPSSYRLGVVGMYLYMYTVQL